MDTSEILKDLKCVYGKQMKKISWTAKVSNTRNTELLKKSQGSPSPTYHYMITQQKYRWLRLSHVLWHDDVLLWY